MGKPTLQALTFPGFGAHKTANQSVSSSGAVVTFTAEDWDDNGWFAGSTFTPTEAGRYLILVSVLIDANPSSSADIDIKLRVAGSTVAMSRLAPMSSHWERTASINRILSLSVGQAVDVFADPSASMTIEGSTGQSWFQGFKLG